MSSGPDAAADDVPDDDDAAEDGELDDAFDGAWDSGADSVGSDARDDVSSGVLLHPKNTEKTIIEAISNDAVFIFFITITSFPK